jgi:hypothetical protein
MILDEKFGFSEFFCIFLLFYANFLLEASSNSVSPTHFSFHTNVMPEQWGFRIISVQNSSSCC